MDKHQEFMELAGQLAKDNIHKEGGPFSAVIVRNNEVIATGCNRVTDKHDPTAHAEIEAIRKATEKLQTHNLSGCVIYASCEPCPMCLGAIYWAHLDAIYFGNSRNEAGEIGFDDDFIYQELEKPVEERSIPTRQIEVPNIGDAFELWKNYSGKIEY